MKNLPYYAASVMGVVAGSWIVSFVMPHSSTSTLFWEVAIFLVGLIAGIGFAEVKTSRSGAKEPVVRCWGCDNGSLNIAYHVCAGQYSNYG